MLEHSSFYQLSGRSCLYVFQTLICSQRGLPAASLIMHYEVLSLIYIFFYLGFVSRTFTIHRRAGYGGGYLINCSHSYQFHLLNRHLDVSRSITQTRTGNLWFPSVSHEPLNYASLDIWKFNNSVVLRSMWHLPRLAFISFWENQVNSFSIISLSSDTTFSGLLPIT